MTEGLPIIRIEIDGMRQAIYTALSERTLALDEHIKRALDEFCDPKNIEALVESRAKVCLKAAVESAVSDFFQFGAGRGAVRAAVHERLEQMLGGDAK